MEKMLASILILLFTACHPEHRRDTIPDNPGRSKHNEEIPKGSKYPIPAHVNSDTGDLPSWKRTLVNDSAHTIKTDSTKGKINHSK